MSLRINRWISRYFNSGWLPAVVSLAVLAVFTITAVPRWKCFDSLATCLLIGLGLSFLGILSAAIWNFTRKQWAQGIGNLLALPVCGGVTFLAFSFLAILGMFGPSEDGFGKGIVIPINHPAISQKIFGGTISAKKVKNLAIPITAEAYGKSPRVMDNLHFAMNKAGVKLLGRTKDGKFEALYVLKKSVHQAADPKALPSSSAMISALTSAAEIAMRKI